MVSYPLLCSKMTHSRKKGGRFQGYPPVHMLSLVPFRLPFNVVRFRSPPTLNVFGHHNNQWSYLSPSIRRPHIRSLSFSLQLVSTKLLFCRFSHLIAIQYKISHYEGRKEGRRGQPYSKNTLNITEKITKSKSGSSTLIVTNCIIQNKRDGSFIKCSLSLERGEVREERRK